MPCAGQATDHSDHTLSIWKLLSLPTDGNASCWPPHISLRRPLWRASPIKVPFTGNSQTHYLCYSGRLWILSPEIHFILLLNRDFTTKLRVWQLKGQWNVIRAWIHNGSWLSPEGNPGEWPFFKNILPCCDTKCSEELKISVGTSLLTRKPKMNTTLQKVNCSNQIGSWIRSTLTIEGIDKGLVCQENHEVYLPQGDQHSSLRCLPITNINLGKERVSEICPNYPSSSKSVKKDQHKCRDCIPPVVIYVTALKQSSCPCCRLKSYTPHAQTLTWPLIFQTMAGKYFLRPELLCQRVDNSTFVAHITYSTLQITNWGTLKMRLNVFLSPVLFWLHGHRCELVCWTFLDEVLRVTQLGFILPPLPACPWKCNECSQ